MQSFDMAVPVEESDIKVQKKLAKEISDRVSIQHWRSYCSSGIESNKA